MAHEIFISYRRKDASAHAEALRDCLVEWYGASKVFLDTREIRPGALWPVEIRDALHAARAVLVLIGPKWRQSLLDGAHLPDGEDWVREEVTTALKRQQRGELPCLLPLLVDEAPMPHTDAWAEAPPSLVGCAGISSIQPLVHPAKDPWAHTAPAFIDLQRQIEHLAQLKPCAARTLAEHEKPICGEIAARVALYPELESAWNSKPSAAGPHRDLVQVVADLERALRGRWAALRPTVKDNLPGFKWDLRRVVTLLMALAIDPAAARALTLQGMQRRAVPAQRPGPAVVTAGALRGLPSYVSAQPVVDSFDTDYTLDADAVDPGVAGDLRAGLHESAWRLSQQDRGLKSDPNYPPGTGKVLEEPDLSTLKKRMEAQERADRPHFLAFLHIDKDHDADPVRLGIAQETGMHAVAYHPNATDILRQGVDRQALDMQVSSLNLYIESLQ